MGDFEGWFAQDIDAFDRRVSPEFAYIFVLVSLGLLGWPSAPLKGWIAGARCEQWCATNSFPDAVSAAKWFVNDKKNEAKGDHMWPRRRKSKTRVFASTAGSSFGTTSSCKLKEIPVKRPKNQSSVCGEFGRFRGCRNYRKDYRNQLEMFLNYGIWISTRMTLAFPSENRQNLQAMTPEPRHAMSSWGSLASWEGVTPKFTVIMFIKSKTLRCEAKAALLALAFPQGVNMQSPTINTPRRWGSTHFFEKNKAKDDSWKMLDLIHARDILTYCFLEFDVHS